MVTFLAIQIVSLVMLAAAAWGAGSMVASRLECGSAVGLAAVRMAAGLATLGFVFVVLGMAGALNATASTITVLLAVVAGATRLRDVRGASEGSGGAMVVFAAAFVPVFALCLYPPIAFDETLYHLPTVERFAESGHLPFIAALRFPILPHLDEVLRVPLFQLAGDVATHHLSLLATLVTAGIIFAWFSERGEEATGWLGVALFVSGPLVVYLATTGYVESLLTMFVAMSFYALDRWRNSDSVGWLVAAGCFAGSSAAVKYLGFYSICVIFAWVIWRKSTSGRFRSGLVFAVACGVVMLPWYGRIYFYTGNPLFPYVETLFGPSDWGMLPFKVESFGEKLLVPLRLPWDSYFARERLGHVPPLSPALFAVVPLVAYRAFRDAFTRALALIVVLALIGWLWLPRDARYLASVIPLASVAGAISLRPLLTKFGIDGRRALGAIALVVMLPGPLYALYSLVRNGPIPVNSLERESWLMRTIPEYGAIAFLNAKGNRDDVTWLCGGEQLAYYFRGDGIGDWVGPARFDLIVSARDEAELDMRASALDARYILVAKRHCSVRALQSVSALTRFRVLYDDAATRVYERISSR